VGLICISERSKSERQQLVGRSSGTYLAAREKRPREAAFAITLQTGGGARQLASAHRLRNDQPLARLRLDATQFAETLGKQ